MPDGPQIGPWLCGLLCVWTTGYALICCVLLARRSRAMRLIHRGPPQARLDVPAAALVMRPCAGADSALYDALMSGAALRADVPGLLVHLVPAGDAAEPIARRTATTLKSLGLAAHIRLTAPEGLNHKAAQLASFDNTSLQYGVCICIDSDVRLMPDTLRRLCAPLADPKCGAAWLPFVQQGLCRSAGDRINGAVLQTSLQSFALLRYLDQSGFVGKLVAIRPEALVMAGGWQSVTDVLGEDTTLSQRLVKHGWQVRCAEGLGYTEAQGRTLEAVFERFARWLTVMRQHRPLVFLSYPFFVCAMPPLLIAWALLCASPGYRPYGALGACATLVARLSIWRAGHLQTHTKVRLRDLCVLAAVDIVWADALLCAAFITAAMRRSLVWRGRRIRFNQGRQEAGRGALAGKGS